MLCLDIVEFRLNDVSLGNQGILKDHTCPIPDLVLVKVKEEDEEHGVAMVNSNGGFTGFY